MYLRCRCDLSSWHCSMRHMCCLPWLLDRATLARETPCQQLVQACHHVLPPSPLPPLGCAFAWYGFSPVIRNVNIDSATRPSCTRPSRLAKAYWLGLMYACTVWSCMLTRQPTTPSAGANPYMTALCMCWAPLCGECAEKDPWVCAAAHVGQVWLASPGMSHQV